MLLNSRPRIRPSSKRVSPSIYAEPKRGQIYWTAFTDLEGDSSPTDPLRFDMYTQRLGNLLLPGITNRTERLRYLSMVCAGLAETGRGGSSIRDQRRAFLPFERGWALAMTVSVDGRIKLSTSDGPQQRGLRPEFRGLRGANRVLAHFRTLGDRAKVRPAAYKLLQAQEAQGGLGAYFTTLRQFGFVHPDSLALTALGRELAGAFAPRDVRGARLTALADDRPLDRGLLGRMGRSLSLGRPTTDECDLVGGAMFVNKHSVVADVIRRMRAARPDARTPEELLSGIARRDGDQIELAAAYALAFDPLRIAALQLFARLGESLRPRTGAARLSDLDAPRLEAASTETRERAEVVAGLREVEGLAPISHLARDLASAKTLEATVSAIVSFHRREERSWIVAEGTKRFRLGRHGRFQEPDETFNGYTVGRAFQLLADTEAAA
jgi:hypothetical protein